MFQAVANKMQYTLLRVMVHEHTKSLLFYEQAGMMLTEEPECRAVKDGMLFIPHMGRAMSAKTLLTRDNNKMLLSRPCTTGSCLRQPRRKRSIRLIFLANAERGRRLLLYRSCARRRERIAAPEPAAPKRAGGGSLGWAGAGVKGCGLQPLPLLFVPLLHDG